MEGGARRGVVEGGARRGVLLERGSDGRCWRQNEPEEEEDTRCWRWECNEEAVGDGEEVLRWREKGLEWWEG